MMSDPSERARGSAGGPEEPRSRATGREALEATPPPAETDAGARGTLREGAGTIRRGRGLRDLAIAIAIGALIWFADRATGRHLERGLVELSRRLAIWYEERREPVVNCRPARPTPYDALGAVAIDVPACWQVEIGSLLGQEIHTFRDPEARAGKVLASAERLETEEAAAAALAEFERLASSPGAIVDGLEPLAAESGVGGPTRTARAIVPSAEGVAERILRSAGDRDPVSEAKPPQAGGAAAGAPSGAAAAGGTTDDAAGEPWGTPEEKLAAPPHGTRASTGAPRESAAAGASPAGADPDAPSAPPVWRAVEVHGRLGPTAARPVESALSVAESRDRSTWTFFLLGERAAVRIVYIVREDWAESSVVARELDQVREMAASTRDVL